MAIGVRNRLDIEFDGVEDGLVEAADAGVEGRRGDAADLATLEVEGELEAEVFDDQGTVAAPDGAVAGKGEGTAVGERDGARGSAAGDQASVIGLEFRRHGLPPRLRFGIE